MSDEFNLDQFDFEATEANIEQRLAQAKAEHEGSVDDDDDCAGGACKI